MYIIFVVVLFDTIELLLCISMNILRWLYELQLAYDAS